METLELRWLLSIGALPADQFTLEPLPAQESEVIHFSNAGAQEDDHERALAVTNYFPPESTLVWQGAPPSQPDGRDALVVALDYLRQNAARIGLTAADLDDYVVTDRYTSEHTGVTHIYLRQTLNGLEVANAEININVLPDGRVLNAGSSFLAGLAPLKGQWAAPQLSAPQALTALASNLQLPLQGAPQVRQAGNDKAQTTLLAASGISLEDIPARLQYVPTPRGAELSWNLTVLTTDGAHGYNASVSSRSGETLFVADWVSDATYNVFALPKESPSDGARTLEVDPHLAAINASPLGWHDTNGLAGAEFTVTRGNNVHAYADRNNDNVADAGSDPDGGALLEFNFALDLGQQPLSYRDAAVTNLFYWNNILHDVHYQYGFTEAAGNFQVNNYGKGGLGNDGVRAEAQDGADIGNRNNANFFTPPDGQLPRMQMYLWSTATPERDGDLDTGIIAHEFGHGVSNRLTGGPSNASALDANQSGGMGEGWSDFYALMFTQISSDQATDGRGMGTYALNQAPNGPGIRTQRYSYDMNINNHTYGKLASGTLSVPHGIGEVWAATIWDLNWALIDGSSLDPNIPTAGLGFDPDLYNGNGGNNLAMQLIMDGMKLQPANPSFLDARDAILAADVALTGGQYQQTIWTVFARRGMGFSADDGGSANSLSVTEAFDLPATKKGTVAFDKPVYDVGQTVQIRVTDLDLASGGPVNVAVVSNGGDSETVALTEGLAGVFTGTISTVAGAASSGNGQLDVAAGETLTVTYNDADSGGGIPAVVTDTAQIIVLEEIFNGDFSDSAGNPFLDGFTVDNSGAAVAGLWHLSTGRGNQSGHTSDDSMYFGTAEGANGGGNYNVGHTAGRIMSPSIDLSDTAFAELTFNYFLGTEALLPYDAARVLVSKDNGPFQLVAGQGSGLTDPTTGWTAAKIDLTPFIGGAVRIQFDFDTMDDVENNFEGWYVDDVVVRVASLTNGEIHGTKWNDLNGDGVKDAGEPGCPVGRSTST